ncbi:hypothetical protein BJ742DRAFT_869641 [Cladochytrium replicatum]|nr:hypothetical protein BJ742DRAFT_869641 [Cladochytrium replicatum]
MCNNKSRPKKLTRLTSTKHPNWVTLNSSTFCINPSPNTNEHQRRSRFRRANGDIAVLYWWVSSGLELKWSCNAIDYRAGSAVELSSDELSASRNSHVGVLDWWFKSRLVLKVDHGAFYDPSNKAGNVNVVEWKKTNRTEALRGIKWENTGIATLEALRGTLNWS